MAGGSHWDDFVTGLSGQNLDARIRAIIDVANEEFLPPMPSAVAKRILEVANDSLDSWGGTYVQTWSEAVMNFTAASYARIFIALAQGGSQALGTISPPTVSPPGVTAPGLGAQPASSLGALTGGQVIVNDLLPAGSLDALRSQFKPVFEGIQPVALTGSWSKRQFLCYDYIRKVWWAVDEIYALNTVGDYYRYACYNKLDNLWYPANKIILPRGD